MEKRSLGLIETWGYVPAVEAADAGAKAANVVFLGYEKVQAGLVTIRFLGEVAAVQAAVSAGAAAAEKVGRVVAVHVIPRPDPDLAATEQAELEVALDADQPRRKRRLHNRLFHRRQKQSRSPRCHLN